MAFSPICLFSGHKVHRNRVKFDGQHYYGPCRRCGAPLTRLAHGWKRSQNPSV